MNYDDPLEFDILLQFPEAEGMVHIVDITRGRMLMKQILSVMNHENAYAKLQEHLVKPHPPFPPLAAFSALQSSIDTGVDVEHPVRFYHLQFNADNWKPPVHVGKQVLLAEAIARHPFDFYLQVQADKVAGPVLKWPETGGEHPELWNRIQASLLSEVQTIRDIHFAKAPFPMHSHQSEHGFKDPGSVGSAVCGHIQLTYFPGSGENAAPASLLDLRISGSVHT